MSSASRALAPREGLGCLIDEDGPYDLLAQPRHGPQAGKSGDPRSQNADSSPGPMVRSGFASRRSQGSSMEIAGPKSLRPRLTHGG